LQKQAESKRVFVLTHITCTDNAGVGNIQSFFIVSLLGNVFFVFKATSFVLLLNRKKSTPFGLRQKQKGEITMTKKLTTSAIMLALSVVLSFISKIIPAPWLQGGSITLASMVPIIVVSLMYDLKFGLICSFAYSLIQIMSGFYHPPTQDFLSFTLVVLLDYVFAFGVLGLSSLFYKLLGKKIYSIPISGAIVTILRYICHIFSGVLIWGVYAKEGQSVLSYSLIYNGTYMVPEIIITTVVLALLAGFIQKTIKKQA